MKIKKARKIWNAILRGESLNWNKNTIEKAMNIAHIHFIKLKIAGELDNMKDWTFRKQKEVK